MLPDFPGQAALAACLVLLPAGVRLWTGRSLSRSAGDPMLGERLLASQRVNSLALLLSIALLVVVSRRWWLFPLMLVAYIAAAYPLRRSLYEETWSLGAYLSFMGRLLFGTAGFWIAVALAPVVVAAAGTRDWIAAAALGGLLVAWQARQADVLRFLMRTKPVADPALRARFEQLAQRCSIALPRFEQVDMRGGVIANAVALASRRGSSVVFTDTLLARLEPGESAAICAHELAHIEHFTPQRLRRIAIVTCALIVIGVSSPVIARLTGLDGLVMWVCWGGVFFLALIWLARDRQKNETSSDIRAVAITGDGEALVRALTKGYTISRMPRRLHPEYERQATHPSLARRIRDIRRAAGASPSPVAIEASLTAPDASTTVTFQTDRLNWQEGEAALHSLSYAHLSELRVHATRSGRATLVAVENSGRRWEMPLLDVDVSRAQAVLDVVDERLSDAARRPSAWPKAGAAAAALLTLIALPLGTFSTALVALIAAVRPAPALLGAGGASGLVSAVLVLRDQIPGGSPVSISFGILAAAFGVILFIAATAVRQEGDGSAGTRRPTTGAWLAVLGTLAIVSVALLLVQATSIVRLHLWSRAIHAAAVLPVAIAGGLVFWRPRGWRAASFIAGAAGIAAMSAGSVVFLDAFGRDALLVPAPPLRTTVIRGTPRAEIKLDFIASQLRLSPSGTYVAVARGMTDEYEETSGVFLVGPASGSLVEVPATDVLFIDDEHVLAMEPRRGGFDVRLLRADSPGVRLWERHVPDIVAAQLASDANGRWQAVGFDTRQGTVRVEGRIGDTASPPARWTMGRRMGALIASAGSGDTAVGVETRYSPGVPMSLGLWRLGTWLPFSDAQSNVWVTSGSKRYDLGSSRLELRCVADRGGTPRVVCITFEGTRSRFVMIDGASRRLTGIGVLAGRFFTGIRAADGWVPGWYDGHSAAVHLETGELVRVEPETGNDVVTEVTGAGRAVGAVLQDGTASTLHVYSLDQPE